MRWSWQPDFGSGTQREALTIDWPATRRHDFRLSGSMRNFRISCSACSTPDTHRPSKRSVDLTEKNDRVFSIGSAELGSTACSTTPSFRGGSRTPMPALTCLKVAHEPSSDVGAPPLERIPQQELCCRTEKRARCTRNARVRHARRMIEVADDGRSTVRGGFSDGDLRDQEPIKECPLVVGQRLAKFAMNDGTRAQPFIQTAAAMNILIETNLGWGGPVTKVETPARSRHHVHW